MKEPTTKKSESKDRQNKELVLETKKTEDLKEEPNPLFIEPILVISYPQRLRKSKLQHQYAKFMEVFKKQHINIPFAEALEKMPIYVKFIKENLKKKKKLGDYETVALSEECSAFLQKKLPQKLKDPESFTIS